MISCKRCGRVTTEVNPCKSVPPYAAGEEEMVTSDAGCYHEARLAKGPVPLCYGENHRPMHPPAVSQAALTECCPQSHSFPVQHGPDCPSRKQTAPEMPSDIYLRVQSARNGIAAAQHVGHRPWPHEVTMVWLADRVKELERQVEERGNTIRTLQIGITSLGRTSYEQEQQISTLQASAAQETMRLIYVSKLFTFEYERLRERASRNRILTADSFREEIDAALSRPVEGE